MKYLKFISKAVLSLIVFALLTNTLMVNTVKALTESLQTDKDTYEIGDPIYVTANSNVSGSWVGFYNAVDGDGAISYYWYYVSDHAGESFNMFDGECQDREGYTKSWNFPVGNYKVVLKDGAELLSKTVTITSGSSEQGVFLEKEEYSLNEPINLKSVSHEVSGTPWVGIYNGHVTSGFGGNYVGWYFCAQQNNVDKDLREYGVTTEGEYTAVLFNDGGYSNYINYVHFTVTKPEVKYITTDKETYDFYKDTVEVTVNKELLNDIEGYDSNNSWVGLYKKGESYEKGSIYWIYVKDLNEENKDITKWNEGRPLDFAKGEYNLVLFKDGGYTLASSTIFKMTGDSELNIDLTNAYDTTKREFKYSDPINVSGLSTHSNAWVGLYAYDNSDPLDTTLIDFYYLSGKENPVNITDVFTTSKLKPGHYKLILFTNGFDIDTDVNNNLIIRSFYVVRTYNDPQWSWSDDYTNAKAVFVASDNNKVEEKFDANVDSQLIEEAKCETTGLIKYTASFAFDETNTLLLVSGKTEFSKEEDVVTDALGHNFSVWELDQENPGFEKRKCDRCEKEESREVAAHDHVTNLVKHDRVEATCTEDGNIEYYVCSLCGRYYEDANAETEIEPTDIVIKALNHNYGDWVYDEENHQHQKICANDKNKTHVEIEDCDFSRSIFNGNVVYTCDICGGSYNVPIISVEKDEYYVGEPVLVTINTEALEWVGDFNPSDKPAWIGLYKADDDYGENGDKSILWAYINNISSTSNMLTWVNENGRFGEYADGEFKLVLFKNWAYEPVTSISFNVLGDTLYADEIDIELNGEKITEDKLIEVKKDELSIKVKASVEGEAAMSWVGFYVGGYGKGKVSDDWYYVFEKNGIEHDFTALAPKYGICEIVVFGNSAYDDVRRTIAINILREPVSEEIIEEPTCTIAGKKLITYENEEEEYKTIPALGHDYGEWFVEKQATCEEDGVEKRICSHDEAHYETRTIPALGHDYGEWTWSLAENGRKMEPTTLEDGLQERKCSHDSSHIEYRIINKIGQKGYEITETSEEDDDVYVKGTPNLVIKSNAPKELLVGVFVDKIKVEKENNYDVEDGSTKIIFRKSFLDSLPNGNHKFVIMSYAGYNTKETVSASTDIRIAPSPTEGFYGVVDTATE